MIEFIRRYKIELKWCNLSDQTFAAGNNYYHVKKDRICHDT